MRKDLGLVHIYCGEGKGKTTCAVGLTVRASGYGLKVLFMQFLKSGNSSELKVLRSLPNVTVENTRPVTKFSFQMTEEEKKEIRELDARQFAKVAEELKTGKYDIFVLDECLGAIQAGLFDESLIADFIKNKPEGIEVVLTGRYPSDTLVGLADYVSRIDKVKHPYDRGIKARAGIEA